MMPSILQGLLLAETCLYVYGAPTYVPGFSQMQDSSCEEHCASSVTTDRVTYTTESAPLDKEHVTSFILNVGAGGGTGPHGGPEGIGPVTQTKNEDSTSGKFGLSKAGREAQKKIESDSEEEDVDIVKEDKSVRVWGHDGPTKSSSSDLILPEIGPLNMMPRDDGLESLWTEAARPAGADTVVPLSQDEATEATMSSEALPLIFEPFEDVTEEGPARAAAVTVVSQAPVRSPGAMATRLPPTSKVDPDQLVAMNTDSNGPSREPPALLSDWTSPWQASGSELLEPVSTSGTSSSQQQVQTEHEEHPGIDAVRNTNSEANMRSAGTSIPSPHNTITTMASHQLLHKSRTGIEEMESEEELDEDEDDENSEESVEEDSEEDLTEAPETSSTQPPYNLIPPPPVWVPRNQRLMRSWAELIREKAGYVSGMLAPVGIGITGALLIVGALYSIRMLHRKRRNSFKHQRRKARQPEQPREPGTSCQDQAMLLADSSEDEF
ncbi:uncharacterized protein armh4 [Anableps anableps]